MSPMTGKDAYPHLFILSFFKNPKRHTMYRIVNVQSWWLEGSVVQKWGENGNTDDNPQEATPNGCNLPRGKNFFLQPNRVDFVPQWLHIFSPRTNA